MSEPKFSVGEEVILWPPEAPKYQGFETVITAIDTTEGGWSDGCNEIGYCVDPPPIPSQPTVLGEMMMEESIIRKKPKGCGKSFKEVMAQFKSPVGA